jgi:ABC-type transporter MlaC component
LRKDDNGVLKIIDLSVKGFSMILTLRGDFGSVVKTKGIDGLIKLLKDKESK